MLQSEDSHNVPGKPVFMVVDDEPSIVLLIRRLLERAGNKVFSENDSVKALDFIKENYRDIDVLICDMTMPKLSGEQLISEVMTFAPEMPVILISGISFKMPETLKKFSTITLLEKPIQENNLFETIGCALKNNPHIF